jgi:hypothetical protein
MTEPIYAQIFCTLAELDEDLNLLGSERESRVMPKILQASDFLQKNIGWFLPVQMTRLFNGHGAQRLYVPPLLGIDAISNDGTSLSGTDYVARPQKRYWPNGPYSWLDVGPDASLLGSWACEEDSVSITGQWGLYDLSKSLGITLTANQSDSATSVSVSNGAAVSPGMVCLIGSEQQYVEATGSPASVTTITEALDSDSNLVTFADGSLLYVGEVIRIGLEQMKILDISGNQAAVVRGWNKTIRAAHADNASVSVYRTFTVTRGVNGTTAAAHSSGASVSQQRVPDDVNGLCRKMAARMLKDAQGGYSGVIGETLTGQAQYLYVMPKELAEIRNAYRIIHMGAA